MSIAPHASENKTAPAPLVDKLRQEVAQIEEVIRQQQELLFKARQSLASEIMRSIRKEDESPSS